MATQQITGRQIKDGVITNAKVATGAAIDSQKLANWSANRNAGGFKLEGLADGTAATDAATYGQVQAIAAGLAWKDSVRAASTGNLTLSGAQTVDGVSLIAGDRCLVKNQTTGSENGIYVVAAGAWSRASDADTAAELESASMFVEEGTANANTMWTQTLDNFTLGTDTPTFVQFSAIGDLVAGAGLTKTSNTIDVVAGDASVLVNANELHVQLSGSTLATDGSGLKVADAGITGTQIAASVAGGGLAGGAGSALSTDERDETPGGTVNGANTAFTITTAAKSDRCVLTINGVRQEPTTHYTLSGTALTISDAPETGDILRAFFLAA